jgi:phosphate/sulfate permease
LFTIYKGGTGVGLDETSVEVALISSSVIACVFASISYPFVRWWAAKVERRFADGVAAEEQKTTNTDKAECVVDEETECAPPLTPLKGTAAAELPQSELSKHECVEHGQTEKAGPEDVEVGHTPTERVFTGFVVIIAGFFSLAHGANDVANSVGPFGAVLAAFEGPLQNKSAIPLWVFAAAGCMIVVGLATYGIHVMQTIGGKITPMTPSKAFVANFAATIVVLIATRAGIPLSTTHASVGAVVGVGFAEGMRSVDWKVLGQVFVSWMLTLPVVGITASGIFALLLPCMVDVPFVTIKT